MKIYFSIYLIEREVVVVDAHPEPSNSYLNKNKGYRAITAI